MANEHLRELIEEEQEAGRQLKMASQDLRIIQNKRKQLTARELTRRLCEHGRILEKYFPPEMYSDEMVEFILRDLFVENKEKTQSYLDEVRSHYS